MDAIINNNGEGRTMKEHVIPPNEDFNEWSRENPEIRIVQISHTEFDGGVYTFVYFFED